MGEAWMILSSFKDELPRASMDLYQIGIQVKNKPLWCEVGQQKLAMLLTAFIITLESYISQMQEASTIYRTIAKPSMQFIWVLAENEILLAMRQILKVALAKFSD